MEKLDSVWMIVDMSGNVWYSPPATNAADAWDNARQWEQWCKGGQCIIGWTEEMKLCGYRAKKVEISI